MAEEPAALTSTAGSAGVLGDRMQLQELQSLRKQPHRASFTPTSLIFVTLMALAKGQAPAEKALPSIVNAYVSDNALYFSHWHKTVISGPGFEYSLLTTSDDLENPKITSISRGGMVVAEIRWEYRNITFRMGGNQSGQPWLFSKSFLQRKGVFNP